MYQKTVLDNGLRLITANMPHTRSVCVTFFIGTGSRYEPEAEAGISHFVEHLLFKGTEKRPSAKDISEAIESVGGILNGGTDKELTIYWCKVAQHQFHLALEVLTDMLRHARFDPTDIEKERQVITEEINMMKDSPSQEATQLIDELLWPGHPLGRDIAGSKESVAQISREAMLDYLEHQYQPEHSVVSVAGNLEHQETVTAVSQMLGDWGSQQPHLGYAAYQPGPVRRVRVENRDTEQGHLCLALPGLSLFHPRRFVLDLLNVILGEGMSSRLFSEIRDQRGLVYSIHSYIEHFLDSGALTIYAGVEPKNLATAIQAILAELAKLKEPVPDTELNKAKELSKGRLLLRMEDSRNVAGWLGGQEILTGDILTLDQIVAIIDAITAEEIRKLAEELMVSDGLRLAVVGPIGNDQPLEDLLKL